MKNEKQELEEFYKIFQKQHSKPYFHFTNLEPTKRLKFELVDNTNYNEIYTMFKDDECPFVISEFKNLIKLEKYVSGLLNYHKYSPKRGACDWLFKLNSTGEYVGIIQLYDLNLESYNDNNKKCSIGFTTKKSFRRKHYTTEAVFALIEYIFCNFDFEKILADTYKEDVASNEFLKKIGFKYITKDRRKLNGLIYYELNK